MSATHVHRIAAEFDREHVPTVACVNRAQIPLDVDWPQLVPALDAYADLVGRVWGTPARIVDAGEGPIPKGHWGIVFLDDPDRPDSLGYHEMTDEGFPIAKVFTAAALAANEPISVTASHELIEMLVDPGVQLAAIGSDDVWYAYEPADPVQRHHFMVEGVPMCDFVYPAWFEGFRKPHSMRFDHMGICTAPFELTPGGYISVHSGGQWTQRFGSKEAEARFRKHPRRRSQLRVRKG